MYAISTAILFTMAVFEPQHLKPQYYNFLSKTTGGKLYEFNRKILDVYGTNSAMLMNDFWPNLSEKHTSSHMKRLIEMKESTSNNNEEFRELLLKFINVK